MIRFHTWTALRAYYRSKPDWSRLPKHEPVVGADQLAIEIARSFLTERDGRDLPNSRLRNRRLAG